MFVLFVLFVCLFFFFDFFVRSGGGFRFFFEACLATMDPGSVNIDAKLVVLGCSAVGKTSIALRYVQDVFSSTSNPTIGASFLTKRVYVCPPPTASLFFFFFFFFFFPFVSLERRLLISFRAVF